MAEQASCLYVVFAATPLRMGRFIRLITHHTYNHVAISLEADLRHLYSFARRYKKAPFYGGFVRESCRRYYNGGCVARIEVCAIPLSQAQLQQARACLQQMEQRSQQYLYNHFSALCVPLHHKVSVCGAYTCAEFAVALLENLGLHMAGENFYSISQLAQRLQSYRIYSGNFSAAAMPGSWDGDTYPNNLGYMHSIWYTLRLFAQLAIRRLFPARYRKLDPFTD